MFLGAPGAGKGTYASRIAPLFKIPTISTGDLVRHEISKDSSTGSTIKVTDTNTRFYEMFSNSASSLIRIIVIVVC